MTPLSFALCVGLAFGLLCLAEWSMRGYFATPDAIEGD